MTIYMHPERPAIGATSASGHIARPPARPRDTRRAGRMTPRPVIAKHHAAEMRRGVFDDDTRMRLTCFDGGTIFRTMPLKTDPR